MEADGDESYYDEEEDGEAAGNVAEKKDNIEDDINLEEIQQIQEQLQKEKEQFMQH